MASTPVMVAPRTGAWIETPSGMGTTIAVDRSPPARGRGLKPSSSACLSSSASVAPRTGAWIETRSTSACASAKLMAGASTPAAAWAAPRLPIMRRTRTPSTRHRALPAAFLPIMANTKGALVTSVLDGEPASKAGIKTGDVITAVGGEPVEDSNQLLRRVAAIKPGESTQLTLVRNGSPLTVSITLGQRDAKKLAQNAPSGDEDEGNASPAQAASIIGLSVRAVSAQEAKALGLDRPQGLLVTDVEDGSEAEQADVRPGDLILEVNQRPVNSPDEFKKIVGDDGKKKGVVMVETGRLRP